MLDKLADEARTAADQKVENAEALHVLVELARGQGPKVVPRIEARLAALIKENEERAVEKPKVVTDGAQRRGDQRPRGSEEGDVPLERLPRGPRAAPGRRPGDRRPRPPPDPGPARTGPAGQRLGRARVPARRSGRGRRPPCRRSRGPDRLDPTFVACGGSAVRRRIYSTPESPTVLGRPSGVMSPIRPGPRAISSCSTIPSPVPTSSRSRRTPAPGPARRSPITACQSCPSPVEGNAQDLLRSARARPSTSPGGSSRAIGFNRLTVQVTPQKVRYLVNDHLFYEDTDPSPTSPWLGLLTSRERYSAWRNMTLKGQPKIPCEVRLSHGDRLEGWVSSFYGESQPPRRTDPAINTSSNANMPAADAAGSSSRNRRGPGGRAGRSTSTITTGRPRTA